MFFGPAFSPGCAHSCLNLPGVMQGLRSCFALSCEHRCSKMLLHAEVMDPIKESYLEKEGLHSNPSALTAALGSSPAVGSTS